MAKAAEERDFNEVLEDIFLHDDSVHKSSYKEGYDAGVAAGSVDGFHLGYHRGAELGRELGYYLGIVSHYIDSNKTDSAQYSEKIVNQLCKVKELIEAFPRTNSEEEDLLGAAEHIRAQYRKACALLKISSANPHDASLSF